MACNFLNLDLFLTLINKLSSQGIPYESACLLAAASETDMSVNTPCSCDTHDKSVKKVVKKK